jgi:hypothetical protein
MTLTLPHGARTMRRDTATWAVRADVVVIANTRHAFSGEPEQIIPCVSDRTSIASTASRPANRDDRDTPLSSGRDKGIKSYNGRFVKGAASSFGGIAGGIFEWAASV